MRKYVGEPLNILHTVGLDTMYPIIRCELDFTSQLNRQRFTAAVAAATQVVPELLCCYDLATNSFVQIADSAEQVIEYNVAYPDEDIKNWNLMREPQIKIYWCDYHKQTKLVIYLSHILTDGAGGKQLLYLLAKAYSEGPEALSDVHNYQKVAWLEKLISNYQKVPAKQTDHPANPLLLPAIASNGQKARYVGSLSLTKTETTQLIEATHLKGVTVNDVVMTAFGRTIQRFAGVPDISLACPTDMRKFGPKINGVQVANLTSRYNITITTPLSENFSDLVLRVHDEMLTLKNNFQCFDSIKDLLLQYHTEPLIKLQQVVQDNYHVRDIAYTNFGIVDEEKLTFGDAKIKRVILTGGFRTAPMYQIAVATYGGCLNLAFNMNGTRAEYDCGMAIAANMRDMINDFSLNAIINH
ncbi:condensation domain-containing protein [Lactobacillus sp. ESL0679]|uniref:condensation domain-containing protein n=1 Tax=Lactobacillus sp. ESL0679 TaxID=2983209 RepID=UPI0023F9B59F|nr:condensation domain-containing protein [Lactobacillus sp. ESL0679]MDF7682406.1 condensation domain-containing protein [Lactobacillus sp. ESL0679]